MEQEPTNLNSEESEAEKEMALEEIKKEMIQLAKEDCPDMEPAHNQEFPEGFAQYQIKGEDILLFYYNIMDKTRPDYLSTKVIKYNLATKIFTFSK